MSATAAAGFSSVQRGFLFYTICIPLRLLLTALLYHFGSHTLVRSAAVVSGLASYFSNSRKITETGGAQTNGVWWHRSVHMLTGAIVSLSFIISPKTKIPSTILLVDTLFGVATSFYKQPFGTIK